MRGRKGFTLIELMIVILIVAVLAAVLVPMMRARIDAAKWSEARAGIGNLASGIRAYWAEHQDEAAGNGVWVPPTKYDVVDSNDLDGKYFTDAAYVLTNVLADANGISFLITVTAANSGRDNHPTRPAVVTFQQNNDGTSAWGN